MVRSFPRLAVCVTVVVPVLLWWFAVPARVEPVGESALSVDYRGGRGAVVSVKGVPVIRATSVQLHAPGWAEGYYSSNGTPPKIERTAGGFVARHTAERVAFEATETIRRVSDNRLEVTLAGVLKSDKDVRIEWGIGYLNAFALYGGSYAAAGAGAAGEATSVRAEPPAARDNATVVARAPGVRFDTRLGRIDVTVEAGDIALNLIDGRRVPERSWTQGSPTFFLGASDVAIKPNEPFELRVSIEVAPAAAAPAESVETKARPVPVEQAFMPQSKPVQIIPKPKSLEWRDGRFALSPDTRIVIDLSGAELPGARRAAEVLISEAKARFGWDWSIVADRESDAHDISFVIPRQLRELMDEEYRLTCSTRVLTIGANTPVGYFHGAQTLVQMFQTGSDGAYVPACAIEDGPSLAFRGVHLFPGKGAMPMHRRLIERVLARHKINHVVLECSYTQWDTDRNIWIDISVPKAELAEYVKVLRENFIEPIPLVQSLGHGEWMFRNGANRDIAEDPDTPYAYDVSNPRTYEFIGGIYNEAIEVFDPAYFHIGHDEVTMRGRYPHRNANRGKSVTDLFLSDVWWMHDFLKPRGVKLMLWGDMLLASGEANDSATFAKTKEDAAARRAGVPTDAIVCDWHYQPAKPDAYKSLQVLKDAGFKTIACTWYTPENIKAFADAARLYGAWGLLQTTWAGYSITDETLRKEPRQFSAYLLAAEYAWSADSPGPRELAWDPDETFATLMRGPVTESLTPRAGTQLDLSSAATVPLEGDVLRLGSMPDDEWRFGGVAFRPATDVVALASPLLPKDARRASSVTIDFNATASELCFLQTTAFPAQPGEVVATIEVAYADGGAGESIDLRYAHHTRAWTDRGPAPDATVAWSGKTVGELNVSVRLLRWTNPHPQRRVSGITFKSDHPYVSPVLLGVTALE